MRVNHPFISVDLSSNLTLRRFYTDSPSILDEHNQTHTSNHQPTEQQSFPVPTSNTIATKSSDPSNGTTNEKSTSASKTKVHRCRQCSFVSSVKVQKRFCAIKCSIC